MGLDSVSIDQINEKIQPQIKEVIKSTPEEGGIRELLEDLVSLAKFSACDAEMRKAGAQWDSFRDMGGKERKEAELSVTAGGPALKGRLRIGGAKSTEADALGRFVETTEAGIAVDATFASIFTASLGLVGIKKVIGEGSLEGVKIDSYDRLKRRAEAVMEKASDSLVQNRILNLGDTLDIGVRYSKDIEVKEFITRGEVSARGAGVSASFGLERARQVYAHKVDLFTHLENLQHPPEGYPDVEVSLSDKEMARCVVFEGGNRGKQAQFFRLQDEWDRYYQAHDRREALVQKKTVLELKSGDSEEMLVNKRVALEKNIKIGKGELKKLSEKGKSVVEVEERLARLEKVLDNLSSDLEIAYQNQAELKRLKKAISVLDEKIDKMEAERFSLENVGEKPSLERRPKSRDKTLERPSVVKKKSLTKNLLSEVGRAFRLGKRSVEAKIDSRKAERQRRDRTKRFAESIKSEMEKSKDFVSKKNEFLIPDPKDPLGEANNPRNNRGVKKILSSMTRRRMENLSGSLEEYIEVKNADDRLKSTDVSDMGSAERKAYQGRLRRSSNNRERMKLIEQRYGCNGAGNLLRTLMIQQKKLTSELKALSTEGGYLGVVTSGSYKKAKKRLKELPLHLTDKDWKQLMETKESYGESKKVKGEFRADIGIGNPLTFKGEARKVMKADNPFLEGEWGTITVSLPIPVEALEDMLGDKISYDALGKVAHQFYQRDIKGAAETAKETL